MTKNDKKYKTLTFLNMIAAKILNNYKNTKNVKKSLTCLNMIAAKIMKNYQKL